MFFRINDDYWDKSVHAVSCSREYWAYWYFNFHNPEEIFIYVGY